jgi:hypothetical protein
MSRIEDTAKPIALPLMLGEPAVLGVIGQFLLSSLICLITVRNEFSSAEMIAISDRDREWFRTNLFPPWDWSIWIARYLSEEKNEHWCIHIPMHVDDNSVGRTGPEYVNTQTTTLVVGELCAHVFSSSVIAKDFPGYAGIDLCQIWPPSQLPINTGLIAAYSEPVLLSLAQALGRGIPAGAPTPM